MGALIPRAQARRVLLTFVCVATISAACSRTNISRAQWQSMPAAEKTLYVRTLLGHQQAKAAKGGNDRRFTTSPEVYAKKIDAAYAAGDQRTVDTIFEELGSRR